MPGRSLILSIDQGTTSSRAILFDRAGTVRATASREFTQYYPQPGWVEHDALEILATVRETVQRAIRQAGSAPAEIAALGLTNQRETCLLWDRKSGQPVSRAIVWQCRRTAPLCEVLAQKGLVPFFRERTGLVLDAYFSGTKAAWMLDHIPGARLRAEKGELAFGTIDSWLLWNLSGGKVHATDLSNASRTLLFNIHTGVWDRDILRVLDVPLAILPEVKPSSFLYGTVSGEFLEGGAVPLAGVAGDQQAALFGQACFEPGSMKNTYGTGCVLLLNTGRNAITSSHGLLTTLAASRTQAPVYALEGSVFIAGAAVQWLRDSLRMIESAGETEALARSIPDNGGVYLVPAFVGLGAPYWDMTARGAVLGLTRGSGRAHLARAALEAIAYQTRDIVEAMEADTGVKVENLRVDGGATANDFLMQFQADILGVPVERPRVTETTALGAAYLAGLATGFWKDENDLRANWQLDKRFEPAMGVQERIKLYEGWKQAVRKVIQK